MPLRANPDIKKACEVLLYVAARVPDLYAALKVIYFADKGHLSEYGRLMYGDSYVAMKHGPVPSLAFDIVRDARGRADGCYRTPPEIRSDLTADDRTLTPCRVANADLLSESEIECLDAVIDQYGGMSFAELRAISHREPAYQAARDNDFIPIEAIVASLPDADDLLDYLANG